MRSETDCAREVDAVLDTWRSKALNVLLAVLCALIFAPLAASLAGRGLVLPWSVRFVCIAMYGILVGAAMSHRSGFRWRTYVLLFAVATFGTLQLWVGQLVGDGRLTLLLPPFFALVLIGPRAGWTVSAVCSLLFVGVPFFLWKGGSASPAPLVGTDVPFAYWILQWVLWINKLVLLMVLFSLFVRLQRRAMIGERQALHQLEKASEDRQRLSREVERLGEMERRRLGAELHDGLCQHLTAIRLNCAVAESHAQNSGAISLADFSRIHALVGDALVSAYDIAKGLCPADLGPDALVPALDHLCCTVRERHGLVCALTADPELTVSDPERALNLYRIAAEAVANAVKHARCKRIEVVLAREGGELVLRVSDDGHGTASDSVSSGGLGQKIIAYRVELIGGSLKLENCPDGGYCVMCRVPDRP